jgi:hypothetical protein
MPYPEQEIVLLDGAAQLAEVGRTDSNDLVANELLRQEAGFCLSCDGTYEVLMEVPCTPDCEGRQCGGDGCGGNCGECEKIDCMTATCIEETGICMYNGNACCCQYDEHCLDSQPCTHDYCDSETLCCFHEWICE